MMKCSAFALYGKGDLRPFDLEIPAVEPGGVLVRVNSCGICGSDLRMYFEGPSPRYNLPIMLGHEFAGTVVEAGAEVKNLRSGDLVAVGPLVPCLNCRPCSKGQDNLCENGQVIGVHVPGGIAANFYASPQMVSAGALAKVPAGVGADVAGLTENFACCLHGLRQMTFDVGDRVLIVGDGPIGLTHLQLLHLMGAGDILMTGTMPHRLKMAGQLGVTYVLDVSQHALEKFAADIHFKPDLAVVAAPVVPATQTAMQLVRPGGSVLLFSGYPHGTSLPFDLYKFHYAEKHVHGSIDCTVRDFHNAVELLPRLQMGELITHHFSLTEAPKAFQAARQDAQAVKVMIEP